MSTAPLQVRDLCKSYPTPAEPLVVVRDLNLEAAAGESLAILGPSGCGKSTLLNILGTLDAPTSGNVTLDGVDPFTLGASKQAKWRAGNVGFVFQDHHLLPQCTALENVMLAYLPLGTVKSEQRKRAEHLLDQVGLAERMTHLPSELSGGERQRVAIARALMTEPKLLLCDEPTGNLDPSSAGTVAELLIKSAAERILIAVTHSNDIAGLFDRRLRMSEGHLEQQAAFEGRAS